MKGVCKICGKILVIYVTHDRDKKDVYNNVQKLQWSSYTESMQLIIKEDNGKSISCNQSQNRMPRYR